MAEKKPKHHYVDNERLTKVLVAWKKEWEQAKEEGREPPRLPEYVGHCAYLIAKGMTRRPNFYQYTYLDDMIASGLEMMCRYIHNFTEETVNRYGVNSAYTYISVTIENAFKDFIKAEKRQSYLKCKSIELAGGHDMFRDGDDHREAGVSDTNVIDDMIGRAHEYEKKMEEDREKQRQKLAEKNSQNPDKQKSFVAITSFFKD